MTILLIIVLNLNGGVGTHEFRMFNAEVCEAARANLHKFVKVGGALSVQSVCLRQTL